MGGDGRIEGGLWGQRSWSGVENIIFIKFEVKKYFYIELEFFL